MERSTILGFVLSIAGIAGYVAGIYAEYPGRAFSTTAVMTGITLVAIGRQSASRGSR